MDMHTKALLTVHSGSLWVEGPAVFPKGEENGIPIARMDREPDNGTVPVERDANAHRLAACWNACQGIPTEALEAVMVKEVMLEMVAAMVRAATMLGRDSDVQAAHLALAKLLPEEADKA